jgi:hypothetical protein
LFIPGHGRGNPLYIIFENMYKNNAFFGKKIVAKKTLLDFPRCRRLKVTCNFKKIEIVG